MPTCMDANDDNRQPITANIFVIFYLSRRELRSEVEVVSNCEGDEIHSIFIPTFPKCFFAH
jgi:hypothetical protein